MICFYSSFVIEDLVETMNLANRILGFWIITVTLLCCTSPLGYPINILSNTLTENGLAQVLLSKISTVFTFMFWDSWDGLESIWTKTSVYRFQAFSLCHDFIVIWGRSVMILLRDCRCFRFVLVYCSWSLLGMMC